MGWNELNFLTKPESLDNPNFPLINLTTYLDKGSSLNLVCKSIVSKVSHRKFDSMKLRLTGINQTL